MFLFKTKLQFTKDFSRLYLRSRSAQISSAGCCWRPTNTLHGQSGSQAACDTHEQTTPKGFEITHIFQSDLTILTAIIFIQLRLETTGYTQDP